MVYTYTCARVKSSAFLEIHGGKQKKTDCSKEKKCILKLSETFSRLQTINCPLGTQKRVRETENRLYDNYAIPDALQNFIFFRFSIFSFSFFEKRVVCTILFASADAPLPYLTFAPAFVPLWWVIYRLHFHHGKYTFYMFIYYNFVGYYVFWHFSCFRL